MKKQQLIGAVLIIALTVVLVGCSCEKTGVSGKYFHEDDPESYLELYSDGTFYLYYDAGLDFGTRTGIRGGLDGTYRVKDGTIILSSTLGASKLWINGNELRDEQGKRWVKRTTSVEEAASSPKETKEPEAENEEKPAGSPQDVITAFFLLWAEKDYESAFKLIAWDEKYSEEEIMQRQSEMKASGEEFFHNRQIEKIELTEYRVFRESGVYIRISFWSPGEDKGLFYWVPKEKIFPLIEIISEDEMYIDTKHFSEIMKHVIASPSEKEELRSMIIKEIQVESFEDEKVFEKPIGTYSFVLYFTDGTKETGDELPVIKENGLWNIYME